MKKERMRQIGQLCEAKILLNKSGGTDIIAYQILIVGIYGKFKGRTIKSRD